MKINFKKTAFLVFCCVLGIILFGCKNPFLASADGKYQVNFVTNCETKIDSYRTDKIEAIQELTKEDYVFGGWYTNATFDGEAIKLPYKITQDITLYAKWIDKSKILTFEECSSTSDFVGVCNSYDNVECSDGLLTIGYDYERIIFKNSQSTDLRIKLSNPKAKLIFENFSFSSSKGSLIESSSDILIEYYGNNELSSSASNAISLISSLGTIDFRGKNNGIFELQPNTVTTSTDGSVGVKANKVIIDGGNFVIKGSDGWNNSNTGHDGGDGSTGIMADVVIKNNAVVTVSGGNGADGNDGQDNSLNKAKKGYKNGSPNGKAGDGDPGIPGGDAGDGGNGGNAITGYLKIISGNLSLSGGKGGDGGDGGQGGIGGDGGDNSAINSWTGSGGKGGKGGKAGKGGNGGDSINGKFDNPNLSLVKLIPGKCGENGKPGLGGIGGGIGWHEPPMGGIGSHKNPAGDSGDLGELPDSSPQDGVEHR